MTTMTRGAEAFAAFLKKNEITQAEAAVALGVSDVSIHQWVTGKLRPRDNFRRAIERWSNDEVPAPWWLTDEERLEIDKVAPHTANDFKATGSGE